MNNKKKKEIVKLVIQQYKDALQELVDSKHEALAQIEDNPFLRRKWNILDCIVAGKPMFKMPPTPYKEAINGVERMFEQSMRQLKLNIEAKIEKIYE